MPTAVQMISVVTKRPGEPARFTAIPATLEAKQEFVGGLIDRFDLGFGVDVIFNDDFEAAGFPPSFLVFDEGGVILIKGPVLFVGVDESGAYVSLTTEQVDRVAKGWAKQQWAFISGDLAPDAVEALALLADVT